MAQTAVTLALNGMRDLISDMAPDAPAVPMRSVYVFPDDFDSMQMDESNLPFAIVARDIREPEVIRREVAHMMRHDWRIEVLLCLTAGLISSDAAALKADRMLQPWLETCMTDLWQNQSLNGTVTFLGTDTPGVFFDVTIGSIGWGSRTYWGAVLSVPVRQNSRLTAQQ